MKVSLRTIAAGLTLALTGLLGNAAVAEHGANKIAKESTFPPELTERAYGVNLPQLTRAATGAETESVSIAGAAPPLQYLQVTGVLSQQYGGWENISPSQLSTIGDHGGSYMYVETLEVGYGNIPVAKMNGGQLSGPLASNAVCWDAYGNLVYPCSSGQTLAGYLKYWDVSGYQNGYFTYQNTSINYPWNTMSDSLSIR